MYSIVIPTISKSNNIEHCKKFLEKNSTHEYELITYVDEPDVYYAYNKGVYSAKYDTVVLMNDDMVVGERWDELIPKYSNQHTILTGYVVENNPGKMVDGPSCLKFDCGTNYDNFSEEKFKKFYNYYSKNCQEVINDRLGWYMPVIVNKKSFVTYPNINKFPWYANDILLFHKVLPMCGYKFAQIKMFFYHFSRLSTKEMFTQEELDNVPPSVV